MKRKVKLSMSDLYGASGMLSDAVTILQTILKETGDLPLVVNGNRCDSGYVPALEIHVNKNHEGEKYEVMITE